jgi:HSP20 family protein
MEMMPWRRRGELSELRREMDSLWNRFLDEVPLPRFRGHEWMPSSDVSETKDAIIVNVELPGLEAEDVEVSISGDMLSIKGEKKKETEEKDEHVHRVERFYGSFQRSFRLPAYIQSDKADANFANGVLKITLPKTEETRGKEIKIKVNQA